MRRSSSIWALFLAAALLHCATIGATVSGAADYKLGYIDSERIFKEYNATKQAQADFQLDLEGWARQIEAKQTEIDKMKLEFETQQLMLSDARRKEKQDEYQAKLSEYDQLTREIYDPVRGKVAVRNEQLSRQLVTDIKRVVEEIAADEGYSMIFDAADGNLVFGEVNLDLTDRVVQALNSATPGTTPQN